jgi:hypothetical protein
VDALLQRDLDALTPEALQTHFTKAGFPDFLPDWTSDEIELARQDGRVPVYDHWRAKLASRAAGLDALMNIAGLCSFAQDQAAFDARVKSFL